MKYRWQTDIKYSKEQIAEIREKANEVYEELMINFIEFYNTGKATNRDLCWAELTSVPYIEKPRNFFEDFHVWFL